MSGFYETSRWKLPLLAVNQLQKEVTHNEALTLVDLLLAIAVAGAPQNAPPTAPEVGQCWLIGPAPTGDWAGRAGQIAGWTSGGWRWIDPPLGLTVRAADGRIFTLGAAGWSAPPGIAEPSGGSVVDSSARAAITAVIQALRSQGLLSPLS